MKPKLKKLKKNYKTYKDNGKIWKYLQILQHNLVNISNEKNFEVILTFVVKPNISLKTQMWLVISL